jgi:hypothetical protein
MSSEMELPALLQRIKLNPGDTLVLTFPRSITGEQADRIKRLIEARFPLNSVMVVGEGAVVSVIEVPR